MPAILEPPAELAALPRKKWSRLEIEEIQRTALAVDLERYELIAGDLLQKAPKDHSHM
jgi:hypothetical protein